ncbi:MAG: UvrD-helicase domain-containing protein [Deltaproteobacteria bacterium]|nr:UvrD-helicase domain-containing protein [Deltaproteobacteria bacterium]
MLDLSSLNDPQREAVLHGDGPLLVLAGAGSGKTRVITYRVARLLERGIPAKATCALSFTNKAAEEMRERISTLVGPREAKVLTMSTFHSLGLALLKAERKALGFTSGFTIYDSADQLGVVRETLRSIRADERRFDAKAILARISLAKNAFLSPEELPGDDEYDQVTRLVHPRYLRAMRALAAVDFDDLIVLPTQLMDADEGVRERWEGRFWYLLVDEYQDTNRAQLHFVRRLAARHGNLTVVGDDDQSIYAWRGAETANILEFETHFPGARVIKLEQNYRSTPRILAAANAVIRNNATRRDKALWSQGPGGDRIAVVACPDVDAEAKFACDEIERLRREERRRLADVAILYRSNIQARPFEEALRNRRIPLKMHGGQAFYERKEIKDVIAYLKVAINPRDEISLRRIVNYPARGIGPATLERAAQWATARSIPLWVALSRYDEVLASTRDGVAHEARETAELFPRGPSENDEPESKRSSGRETPRQAVASFVGLVSRAGTLLRNGGRAAQVAREIVETVRLYDDLRDAAPSLAAAQRRIDTVEELLRSLEAHEQRKPGPEALEDYLHFLTLNANDDDTSDQGHDMVTLSTLHGAKGLEWPVVFLVGMEEELLPHARTLYPQGPDVGGVQDVSEERRLAYVGITRARERLYLSRVLVRRKHGKEQPRTPSRFLSEIPEELLEPRDLLAEAKQPVEKTELKNFFESFLKSGG